MENFTVSYMVCDFFIGAVALMKNPSFTAILAAILTAYFTNYFTQRSITKNKIDQIKNNIVYTCDKLISYAILTEKNQLAFRYHENHYLLSKQGSEKFEKYIESTSEYEYRNFHDRALDSHIRFDLEKSRMNKYLHELNSYDNGLAKKIEIFLNKANKYTLRGFQWDFQNRDLLNAHNYLNETFEGIKEHILYKSELGINLREIMKILDLNVVKTEVELN